MKRTLAGLLTLLASAGFIGVASAQTTTTVTRVTSYEYDAYGQLKNETLQPDDPALRISTEYIRAPIGGVDFGLANSKVLIWKDPVGGSTMTRVTQITEFDPKGRFPLIQTNAKFQSITSTFDSGSGAVLSATDPNNLSVTWQYDGWGRKTRETRADGTATTWAYRQCVDSCDWATSVVVTQQWASTNQTSVPREDFTDRLGRTVQGRTWGFDGTAVLTQTTFTAQGYTAAVARPRFQGAAGVWTYYDERDEIGRVKKIRSPSPDGNGFAETNYTYNGRVLSMLNAKNQARTEERNALGQLKSVNDAQGNVTTYIYDGFGNLVRTRDSQGNEIVVGYDALGRKTSLNDPDVGTVTYWVDPLGQTWKQLDAKNQQTTFTFDQLGRMVKRVEPGQESRWDYDTAAKGVGKLAESYTWVSNAKDIRRVMTYDSLGRPDTVTTSLDWDYVTQTGYDSFGRVNVQSYNRRAKGATSGGVTTAIVNTFNASGYVDKTYRRSDAVDTLIWQGMIVDAEGRDTKQQIGTSALVVHSYNANSGRLEGILSGAPSGSTVDGSLQNDAYQYDKLGNLAYRAQISGAGTQVQETFDYDDLNRLKKAQIGAQSQAFTYDTVGNITSKANVGSYTYPVPGYASVRPHAVTGIAGNVAGLVNPGFNYDNNGNLISGLNRAYTWTAADQPLTIDKLSGGQAVQRTEFSYGPEHERVKQLLRAMSGGQPQAMVNTVVYAGAIEKEIDVEKGVTIIRTSLGALGYVEERIAGTAISPNTAGTRNARYFLKDHLGSVIGIVNEAGQLQQRMSYDAWGRRRNLDGSDDSWGSLGTIKNDQDNSGYTGHEQLDQLGLVHMNARLYDPITGRHVNADPTVPDPKDQQAFNRFSYVLNNALIYADPTGLGPEEVFLTLSNRRWSSAESANGDKQKKEAEEKPKCKVGFGCEIAYLSKKEDKPTSNNKNVGKAAEAATSEARDPSGPTSALFDAVKGFWNAGLGTIEGGVNLLSGALPGFPDYNPFLDDYRSQYDTPTFGLTIEVLTGVGAVGVINQINSAKNTVTLYRAVSQAELKQIQRNGVFEAGENSLGGKWFAESIDHARQWGNVMNGKGASTILEVKLPRSQGDQLMRMERLDGIGPARYGELDQLRGAIIRVLGL